jgi:hypothetical protein
MAEIVGLPGPPDGTEFAEVFIFQLYPYASVYLGPEGKLGGQARDRVAGFWRAVGRPPPADPDHLSALLGLYAGLLEEGLRGTAAESEMARRAADALFWEHLAPWVFDYLDRVRDLGGDFYPAWAELLGRTLIRQMPPAPVEGLPLHLREAPPLPDPRTDGARAFLGGLFAPVRSGMILTRRDLARVARAGDLGLRVGERLYVLEHLLAQDVRAALRGLAAEAVAARARHERRTTHLGGVASFWAQRAAKAAALLDDLATEGEGILAPAERAAL